MTEPETPEPDVPARPGIYLPDPEPRTVRRDGLRRNLVVWGGRIAMLSAAAALGAGLGVILPRLPGEAPRPAVHAITIAPLSSLHDADSFGEATVAELTAERDRLKAQLDAVGPAVQAAELRHRSAMAEADRRAAEVARLAAEIRALRTSNAQAEAAFRSFVETHAAALEQVLGETGIALQPLLERADETIQGGQGGPLHPLDGPDAEGAPFPSSLLVPGPLDAVRLQRLERILAAAPLVAPLAVEYRLTSGFGKRRDPFTGRRALHTGLDFVATRGSAVVATSPGRVVRAGRLGAYGLAVEIDHGYGITTLYAHLRKVKVKPGTVVALRTPIGVIGSTGRSTGRHLHYEVRLDGRPLDPRRFLEAGARLVRFLREGTAAQLTPRHAVVREDRPT